MKDPFLSRELRPMLIGRTAKPFDDPGSLFELKLDGDRCLAWLDADETVLVSRRGLELLPRLPELAAIHRQVSARCVLDGEIITGVGGKNDFGNLRSRMTQRDRVKIDWGARQYPASLVVFDILYLGDRLVTARPLEERKALLAQTVTDSERMALARTVDAEGRAFYNLVLQQGLEGVAGKKKSSLYYPGQRTREWVKVKHEQEDDYVIGGYIPAAHVAMLLLGQYDSEGALVYQGRATLGLRSGDFGQVRKAARAEAPPFAQLPPELEKTAAETVWLRPELVGTVTFVNRTQGGLMRQPHFRRLRADKAPQEAVVPEA